MGAGGPRRCRAGQTPGTGLGLGGSSHFMAPLQTGSPETPGGTAVRSAFSFFVCLFIFVPCMRPLGIEKFRDDSKGGTHPCGAWKPSSPLTRPGVPRGEIQARSGSSGDEAGEGGGGVGREERAVTPCTSSSRNCPLGVPFREPPGPTGRPALTLISPRVMDRFSLVSVGCSVLAPRS